MPVSVQRERGAPEIICPTSRTVEGTSAEGQPVEYPAAFAQSEDFGTPVVSYSKPSGSSFPVGGTTVTATATEEGAPSASCSFNVTVTLTAEPPAPPPPLPEMNVVGGPEPRLGCGVAGEGAPWLVLAASAWLARRRRSTCGR